MTAALATAVAAGLVWWLRGELRRRAELVARACHELRGPLAAAHLALHAGAPRGGPLPATLAAVDIELARAGRALEDLAAARRGRQAADVSELVDVAALVRRQAGAWAAVARSRGCELRVSASAAPAHVRGDGTRVAQAVGNLLANAVEHGGGTVELHVRTVGDRVRVEVGDDGAGLPAPVAELVRRPRAGVGRRGRGLAIASDIAARHGGRLVAAPAAHGARIAIELPRWGAAVPEAMREAS